jgi:hypothetical protein
MDFSRFIEFLNTEKEWMRQELITTILEWQEEMANHPKEYTEPGTDEPSIDIRLCIDFEAEQGSWIFRIGSVDYDPYHSQYCAASCITLDTNANSLLDDLFEQVIEQESMG